MESSRVRDGQHWPFMMETFSACTVRGTSDGFTSVVNHVFGQNIRNNFLACQGGREGNYCQKNQTVGEVAETEKNPDAESKVLT